AADVVAVPGRGPADRHRGRGADGDSVPRRRRARAAAEGETDEVARDRRRAGGLLVEATLVAGEGDLVVAGGVGGQVAEPGAARRLAAVAAGRVAVPPMVFPVAAESPAPLVFPATSIPRLLPLVPVTDPSVSVPK